MPVSPNGVLNIFGVVDRPLGNLVRALDPLYQESTLIQVQCCLFSEAPIYFHPGDLP